MTMRQWLHTLKGKAHAATCAEMSAVPREGTWCERLRDTKNQIAAATTVRIART